MDRKRRRCVAALVYDGLCTFEFGIVVEVFGLPRPEFGTDWYRFEVCSLGRGPLRAVGGVTLRSKNGLPSLQHADTIVIPGWRNADERPPANLLKEIRAAHARGARLVSICSGVFVLAASGLLDGKRVTTHWRYAEKLRQRFPNIRVEPDVLYVDEGNILTSAGSAAGIDLCLHIVRSDYGAETANQVARRLVVAPHRDGGQSQYIPASLPSEASGGLARLLHWAQGHLHEALTVEGLARKAAMSPRTFARRFVAETGTTPHGWLTHQRVLTAQRRLESTNDSIDEIAQRVGLGTAATLRFHFRNHLKTTPTAYRKRFSTRLSHPLSTTTRRTKNSLTPPTIS
jgi:AraC family transcriptional regulator, transcriptional activator FtrA